VAVVEDPGVGACLVAARRWPSALHRLESSNRAVTVLPLEVLLCS